jgi:glycosyltransferase involved in cell wall biosynthesis
MKVMFFGNYESGETLSAPTIVAKSIFKKFSKLNHSAIYICYFQDGSKYSRFQKLFGKELVEENVYRCGILRLFGQVLKFKPDIIHLSTLEMFYVIMFPIKLMSKAKFIYTVHGLASYECKQYTKITWYLRIKTYFNEWMVLHQADYIFTLSERNSRFISLYFNINKKRIFLFKNGIVSYPEIIKNYSEQIKSVKIISVGNINREEKGYSFLLESLSLLNFPIELTIISFVTEGQEIFNNLPKNINLKIKGPLDNKGLRQEMVNNDIYIASSRYETFSICLLESMNAGLLFISTDRVGLTDYFPSELSPYIISYGNKAQLAKKIIEIIQLPLVVKNEISNRINKFSLEFEWGKIILELESKYFRINNKFNQ